MKGEKKKPRRELAGEVVAMREVQRWCWAGGAAGSIAEELTLIRPMQLVFNEYLPN